MTVLSFDYVENGLIFVEEIGKNCKFFKRIDYLKSRQDFCYQKIINIIIILVDEKR